MLDPNGLPISLLRERRRQRRSRCGSACPAAARWSPRSGRRRSAGCRCCCSTPTSRTTRRPSARSPTGSTAAAASTGCSRRCCSASAVCARCAPTAGSPARPAPEVFHTNEGHAGFLGVERIRELTEEAGLGFDEAVEAARAAHASSPPTPRSRPASTASPRDLVAPALRRRQRLPRRAGRPGARPRRGGLRRAATPASSTWRSWACGSPSAPTASPSCTATSARDMFAGLWPGFDEPEVPIGYVTNGVHAPTWVAPEVFELAGAGDRRPSPTEPGGLGGRASGSPTPTSGRCARLLRARLVDRRPPAGARRPGVQRGASEAELGWIDGVLDPDVLTIGFARRVPSYKRLTLMLRDPERLTALLLHPERPVQIVIAGKAHPADDGGKKLIQELVRFADEAGVRHRIVFLPNYDIAMAQTLYPGCDVWLNNPLRPLEACGTSGMKAALNGCLNLSVLDGWWDEMVRRPQRLGHPDRRRGHRPRPPRRPRGGRALRPAREAPSAPLFYDRDADGLPDPLDRDGPPHPADPRPARCSPPGWCATTCSGSTRRPPLVARARRRLRRRPGARRLEGAGPRRPGRRCGSTTSSPPASPTPPRWAARSSSGRSCPSATWRRTTSTSRSSTAGSTTPTGSPTRRPLSLRHDEAYEGSRHRYVGEVKLDRPGPFGYTARIVPRHRLTDRPGRARAGRPCRPRAPGWTAASCADLSASTALQRPGRLHRAVRSTSGRPGRRASRRPGRRAARRRCRAARRTPAPTGSPGSAHRLARPARS